MYFVLIDMSKLHPFVKAPKGMVDQRDSNFTYFLCFKVRGQVTLSWMSQDFKQVYNLALKPEPPYASNPSLLVVRIPPFPTLGLVKLHNDSVM